MPCHSIRTLLLPSFSKGDFLAETIYSVGSNAMSVSLTILDVAKLFLLSHSQQYSNMKYLFLHCFYGNYFIRLH